MPKIIGNSEPVLQIQLVMAATGTKETKCGVVNLMMTISKLQIVQPVSSDKLSF